jgi:putative DNA primase/helicase
MKFLEKVFPGDTQSQELLQEWAGYVVSGWTHYQKGIQLIGPPRAGKGTVARILEKLIGKENAVGTTLKTLVSNFGLQDLIGKSLCVVGDAHMENRNSSEVVARLLSITGEDRLPVDRKNKAPWNGKLPVRMMILANKAPRFNDSSGAITGRFVTLHFTQSFAGKEDKELENRLTGELSGILNWALAGLARLEERGYFVQPESAGGIVESQREEGAPHKTFVEDKCVVGKDQWITKEQLFFAWTAWCSANHIRFPGTNASFAAELYAVLPGIDQGFKRINGKNTRVFKGITLDLEPGMDCTRSQSDPRDVTPTERK